MNTQTKSPIRTNRLSASIDRGLYDEKYDIFKIETDQKWAAEGPAMLDAPYFRENKSARSVFFDTSRSFFVLMKRNENNFQSLKNALDDYEGGDNITYAKIQAASLNDRVLVSLLLNSLSGSEVECLSFNNLTGHFFCFDPSWIKLNKKNGNIDQIHCLEFDISKSMDLSLNVKTFSSEQRKEEMKFGKGKNFYSYAQYTYGRNNTLKRKEKDDKGDAFIKHQIRGFKKNNVSFLNIGSSVSFFTTKMGVLSTVISLFNKKFNGLCYLDFEAIDDYETLSCKQDELRKNRDNGMRDFLSERKVNIIDLVKTDISNTCIEVIKRRIKEAYGASACLGADYLSGALNLCVIHDESYYSGKEDPHNISRRNICVQHVTVEDFDPKREKSLVPSLIQNAVIKQEVIDGRFSLFDWKALEMKENVIFVTAKKDEDDETGKKYRHFIMEVKPDGYFHCFEYKRDFFNESPYDKYVNAFGHREKDIDGLVAFESGDILTIENTGRFTVPEIEKLNEHYSETDKGISRGGAARDEYLVPVTDIRLFEENGKTYYFCGAAGSGMNANIENAPNIRSVVPYIGKMRFLELLPLMSVFFVKYGQLTVLPFPFKYLREYSLMKEE